MPHRNRLTDNLDTGVGIIRGGDDGNAVFRGQLSDGARNLGAEADDYAAGAHLNGAQLAFIAVAENNHIVFADIVLEHVRISRRNDHTALLKPLVNVANLERAVKHIDQIPIAGLGLRQRIGVLILDVEARNIAQRQQTLQAAILINNGQRLNIIFVHVIPCTMQRQLLADARHLAVLHIAQARLKRLDVARRLHAKAFEHKFGLRIDVTRAAGYVFSAGQPALEVRVADCRANGIRIRIAVSDNKNWVHALMLLYVIRDGSPSESV